MDLLCFEISFREGSDHFECVAGNVCQTKFRMMTNEYLGGEKWNIYWRLMSHINCRISYFVLGMQNRNAHTHTHQHSSSKIRKSNGSLSLNTERKNSKLPLLLLHIFSIAIAAKQWNENKWGLVRLSHSLSSSQQIYHCHFLTFHICNRFTHFRLSWNLW